MSDYQPRTRERVIEILDAQDSNPRSWQQEAIAFLKRPAPLDGGWALVPREPTVEMIDSSCAAWWKLHPAFPGEKSEPTAGDTVAAIYRAMLAAAPASPEKAEGER